MLFLHVPVRKEAEQALPKIKQMSSELKNSLLPYSFTISLIILMNLPFVISFRIQQFISAKGTMLFSNVNATKSPWIFCGSKQTGIYILQPSCHYLSMTIGFMSCGNVSGLSINADEGDIVEPAEFIKIFENQFKKITEM